MHQRRTPRTVRYARQAANAAAGPSPGSASLGSLYGPWRTKILSCVAATPIGRVSLISSEESANDRLAGWQLERGANLAVNPCCNPTAICVLDDARGLSRLAGLIIACWISENLPLCHTVVCPR